MPKNKLRIIAPLGASLIVSSSLFYASYGIWTKLIGNFLGGYTASALRSVVVLAMLIPVALIFKQTEPLNLRKTWPYIVGMFATSTLIWGPLYYAILHVGVGVALAIAYACIVLGMFVFGRLFAGEKFTKDKLVAAILGLGGLWLIFSPTTIGVGWIGLGAAAISGICTAVNMILSKKIPVNATQSTIFLWTTSVVANFIMALLLSEHIPSFSVRPEWLYLVFFAIVSIIASWSFVKGSKMIDAGAAGILGLLEIVFGVVFGVVFFGEHPTISALVGMGVIIIAAAIPYLQEYRIKNKMSDHAN